MSGVVSLLKISCLFVGALMLTGCQAAPIDIAVAQKEGQFRIIMSQDWGLIFADRREPCLQKISIQKPNSYEEEQSVWMIKVNSDVQCVELGYVIVGQVPDGWEETVPLKAEAGKTYTIRARGIGSGEKTLQWNL